MLLNSTDPQSERVTALGEELSSKYGVPVMPVNCLTMEEKEIREILAKILFEFPVKEIRGGSHAIEKLKILHTLDSHIQIIACGIHIEIP